MINLTNLSDAIEKLKDEDLDVDLLKDILFELFVFETEYTKASNKEIAVLNHNEKLQILDSVPEYTDKISSYKKFFYICTFPKITKIVYQQMKDENLES